MLPETKNKYCKFKQYPDSRVNFQKDQTKIPQSELCYDVQYQSICPQYMWVSSSFLLKLKNMQIFFFINHLSCKCL